LRGGNNDGDSVGNILLKIVDIIRDYQKKISNKDLLDGEQILWTHDIIQGIIHKKTIESWTISNLRAIKYRPISEHTPEPVMYSVGLAVSDTVVMNQYRHSKGSRVGTYTGTGGRTFSGVGISSSNNISQTYGDLVFYFAGNEAMRFNEISDPHGVRRMVEAIKKQGLSNIPTTTKGNE